MQTKSLTGKRGSVDDVAAEVGVWTLTFKEAGPFTSHGWEVEAEGVRLTEEMSLKEGESYNFRLQWTAEITVVVSVRIESVRPIARPHFRLSGAGTIVAVDVGKQAAAIAS